MSIQSVDRPCAICGRNPDPAAFVRIWSRPTPQGQLDLCDGCERKHRELQFPLGLLCREHFHAPRVAGGPSAADADACPACTAVRDAERERVQQNETIDPAQPWGQHIALTCRNHPELRWHTKNISHIGARSIFFAGRDMSTECACPGSDLIVVPQS